MKITISKDFGATIDLTPQETSQLILDRNLPNTCARRLCSLGEKLRLAIEEKKRLPVFIFAGKVEEAKHYARKHKISKYTYVDELYRLRGFEAIELHYVGSWQERRDLVEMGYILSGVKIKSVYEA